MNLLTTVQSSGVTITKQLVACWSKTYKYCEIWKNPYFYPLKFPFNVRRFSCYIYGLLHVWWERTIFIHELWWIKSIYQGSQFPGPNLTTNFWFHKSWVTMGKRTLRTLVFINNRWRIKGEHFWHVPRSRSQRIRSRAARFLAGSAIFWGRVFWG